MFKKIIAIICLTAALFSLTACGKKDKPNKTESPQITPVQPTEEVISTPKISEKYNSIDDTSKAEKDEVRKELLSVAEGCADIYKAADKGIARNVVLSRDTIAQMVGQIGLMGYSAIDAFSTLDMQNPGRIMSFADDMKTDGDIAVSYYMVYKDGQISVYHIGRQSGLWYLIAMTCQWSDEGEPSIQSEGRYVISDVQVTEKGWLIYNRDIGSFDDNQRSNTNAYVFVRVLPYDSTKKALAQRYLNPIGYFENNLFTTDWDESNFAPIDFNSLYAALFGMYNGTDALTVANCFNYYSTVDGTLLYLVPTATFENTVQAYFNIDSTVLKSISDYSSGRGGYYFYAYRDGQYNVAPRVPEPEVVDYWYNSDGTLTMRVDAVFQWYGTDRAFTHDLTVRDEGNGFKYVSNTVYTDENSIVPTYKLSSLLDQEKAKLK